MAPDHFPFAAAKRPLEVVVDFVAGQSRRRRALAGLYAAQAALRAALPRLFSLMARRPAPPPTPFHHFAVAKKVRASGVVGQPFP